MADIRQYRKDKNNSQREDSEYDGRLRKHRVRIRAAAAITAAAVAVLIAVLCIINYGSGYKSYAVKDTHSRNDGGYARYIKFGNGYVRCGKDGIAMYSYDGVQQWNKTYEMNAPLTDVCDSYMAVANTEGNEIYLFDRDGYVSTINTALPIIQLRVSAHGAVAATLEDSSATYISMYDSDGERIYSIKSTVSGDGVPVCTAVSPDGHLLMVSFTSIEAQELATSVVFYNFGEVGQSEIERVVAGYDTYGEQLVAEVRFLGSGAAVAVGEETVSFFKVGEYPKLLTDVKLDFPIQKIFYSDSYVGIEYMNNANQRKIDVYDTSGGRVASFDAGGEYSQYAFAGDSLLMYGENKLRLISMKGKVLFDGSIEEGIVELIPLSGNDEFLCISPDKLMRIELKHGG